MHAVFTEKQILEHFSGYDLDAEASEYLRFHSLRYVVLLHTLAMCTAGIEDGSRSLRILDVGPGFLTQFMRDHLGAAVIDSLGFSDSRFSARNADNHIEFDLNLSGSDSEPSLDCRYDLIVFAEVLEHLHCNPARVMSFLAGALVPGGCLILQTPNACSLPKRLRMLRGQNPFEMIRDDPGNPGHYREYTLKELCALAADAGLTDTDRIMANYFKRQTTAARFFRMLATLVPGTWRDGITLCLKKPSE